MNTSLENITVLALDVDGVLTDGTIAFAPITKRELKTFHVHDGQGISLWQKAGYHVVLISGRDADCVTHRAKELQIPHVYQGSKNKIEDLDNALKIIGATPEQTCFIGDDLGDLAIMDHVSYSIAVGNAVKEVSSIANFITIAHGGQGAVREAIEHLMHASGTWVNAVDSCKVEPAQQ
jgi:3-deoxy-D-manno-octulosonate 8-phosphate phosphatase (KDO 8-P phosphatase)